MIVYEYCKLLHYHYKTHSQPHKEASDIYTAYLDKSDELQKLMKLNKLVIKGLISDGYGARRRLY